MCKLGWLILISTLGCRGAEQAAPRVGGADDELVSAPVTSAACLTVDGVGDPVNVTDENGVLLATCEAGSTCFLGNFVDGKELHFLVNPDDDADRLENMCDAYANGDCTVHHFVDSDLASPGAIGAISEGIAGASISEDAASCYEIRLQPLGRQVPRTIDECRSYLRAALCPADGSDVDLDALTRVIGDSYVDDVRGHIAGLPQNASVVDSFGSRYDAKFMGGATQLAGYGVFRNQQARCDFWNRAQLTLRGDGSEVWCAPNVAVEDGETVDADGIYIATEQTDDVCLAFTITAGGGTCFQSPTTVEATGAGGAGGAGGSGSNGGTGGSGGVKCQTLFRNDATGTPPTDGCGGSPIQP